MKELRMQIQLKQPEIVEALKQYIAKQGLSLTGKTTEVSFTAGRGDTGVSASIVIEDSDMPPLQGELHLDLKQVSTPLSVVANIVPQADDSEQTPSAQVSPEPADDPAPTPPRSSLFG